MNDSQIADIVRQNRHLWRHVFVEFMRSNPGYEHAEFYASEQDAARDQDLIRQFARDSGVSIHTRRLFSEVRFKSFGGKTGGGKRARKIRRAQGDDAERQSRTVPAGPSE